MTQCTLQHWKVDSVQDPKLSSMKKRLNIRRIREQDCYTTCKGQKIPLRKFHLEHKEHKKGPKDYDSLVYNCFFFFAALQAQIPHFLYYWEILDSII